MKQLATCQRGTGEASGVQTEERFTVSTTWLNPEKIYAMQYTGSFEILKKAVEECKYQHSILEPIVLGVEYLNRARANEAQPEQIYHGDKALSEPFMFPSNRYADAEALIEAETNAKRGICEHKYYSEDYKFSVGCFEKKLTFCTDCGIETTSVPWHKYQTYLNTPQIGQTSLPKDFSPKFSTLDKLVSSLGGYEKAIEAIKQRQHYESTDPEEMRK